jgi:hypothetical protein
LKVITLDCAGEAQLDDLGQGWSVVESISGSEASFGKTTTLARLEQLNTCSDPTAFLRKFRASYDVLDLADSDAATLKTGLQHLVKAAACCAAGVREEFVRTLHLLLNAIEDRLEYLTIALDVLLDLPFHQSSTNLAGALNIHFVFLVLCGYIM